MHLTIEQLHQAIAVKDPHLAGLITTLSHQTELPKTPIREGAPTFERFLIEINSQEFKKQCWDKQRIIRQQKIAALEADDAEVSLSQKLRLHEVLLALWQDNSPFARHCLLQVIPTIHLTYGPWRGLKTIFKEAEAKHDTEIYGCLTARFDSALAKNQHSVSKATLAYLTRRAWRYLRRLGETLPALYADAAADTLAHYQDIPWTNTWVANHIFYHETGKYSRTRFSLSGERSLLKNRAFADAWKRTPKPLFSLLERASSQQVQRFAIDSLKNDFRSSLRDIEASWVQRLSGRSPIVDEFIVWILDNVPKFEQAALADLGLKDTVIALLQSNSSKACQYGADYVRAHARDLPLEQLIALADNHRTQAHQLAIELLQARDPRKDIGLEVWGQLLDTRYANELASNTLRTAFGKKELTPQWFMARLLSPTKAGLGFCERHMLSLHPGTSLGTDFFCEVVLKLDTNISYAQDVIDFSCEQLITYDLNQLPEDFIKLGLCHYLIQDEIIAWVDQGRLNPQRFSAEFLKTIAYHPTWEQDPWLQGLKNDYLWAKDLSFSEEVSEAALLWLSDIRVFTPDQLGFEWLMELVQRGEKRYHHFALNVLNKSFSPADFATDTETKNEPTADGEINVDFGGDSFLFTGKLAKMTRSEASKKVIDAGGSNASGVTKKLHYLVIGDEGSSLYGEGRKGSKQVKAEKLIEDGAEIKIISETAFLQMLTGQVREASSDAIEEGCEQLWSMLIAKGKDDAPLSAFARSYFRLHHPGICLAETDRPVDPGMEIPDSFMTFERIEPLFNDARPSLRAFALELASWEFNRWQPPASAIVRLSESNYDEVRAFITKALTAEDEPEHKRYRVAPETLTAPMVYSFCESQDEKARALGMLLIDRNPRLKLPQELFRLTESPDRKVRAFVIKTFWSWYRIRGIHTQWQPKARENVEHDISMLNAPEYQATELDGFLRRMLFEIPPARYPKSELGEDQIKQRLPAIPARKAKIHLIETLRDLALDDHEFAQHITPLLQEFVRSRGQSEQAACLVALTRIEQAHALGQSSL